MHKTYGIRDDMIEARDMAIPVILGDDFEINDERTKGSTDSAHGVVFGSLPEHGEVAVKVFMGGRANERAQNEADLMKTITGLGFVTLAPVAVRESPELPFRAILLTRYEEGLDALNTFSLEENPSEMAGEAVASSVHRVSGALGRLHSEQISHGDPQIKNFGFKRGDLEEPVVFDLENATMHVIGRGQKGRNLFIDRTTSDVTGLARSLARRQYGGPDDDVALTHFENTVVDPYVANIGKITGRKEVEIGARQAAEKFMQLREFSREHNNDPLIKS